VSAFAPPLRLRLDADALVHNWKALARLSGSARTGAAVKANAYGIGARDVVPLLWEAGCRDFFVAHWGEAEALADLVPANCLSVLNGVVPDEIAAARSLGAVPVLNTVDQIAAWKAAGGGRCHVMLDSGINRLGIAADQSDSGLFEDLEIDILMSHLASADEDCEQNSAQLRDFSRRAAGINAARKSFANSAGILLGTAYHFDLTRPGLALYGGIARAELRPTIKQVAFPSARILQIREHAAGSKIGYNATCVTQRTTRIATLAIGYADGYLRGFSGQGTVLYGGRSLPVIGRVSMDLLLVDVTAAPDICEGAFLDVQLALDVAADQSGLSQYELLTGLGGRYERVWD
jgi:alanine racemase